MAVALAASRYSQRQHDPVAVMKTFGLTPSEIQRLYLGNLVVLGGVATALGLVLGWGLQAGALWALPGPGSGPAPGPRAATVRGGRDHRLHLPAVVRPAAIAAPAQRQSAAGDPARPGPR
ncbi:MAG: FtsX-like permease family protein [Gammaproteobacteria bacterium]|nr:FtsX-like permease family protein [Gammaproteobacteria bacterium]